MSITIAIVHHDDEPATLRADLYHVNRYGQVNEIPRQTHEITPGITALVRICENDVLVVRELNLLAADVAPSDADADQTAGDRA